MTNPDGEAEGGKSSAMRRARDEREALAGDLEARVGADRRANGVLMRHVMTRYADPGALCWLAFEDHELLFDPRDDKIGMTLLAGRTWQRRFVDGALTTLVAAGRIGSGAVFVDVGANIGCTTLYAMASGRFVSAVAFEPEPHNRAILIRNLALNGLGQRVGIVDAAAGAASGRAMLHLDRKSFGRHSLTPGAVATPGGALDVAVVTVDAALAARGIAPDTVGLVKIDVEGHEREVLSGMATTLAAVPPLLVEVSGGEGVTMPDRFDALRALLPAGYRQVMALDIEGCEPVPLARFVATAAQHELLIY